MTFLERLSLGTTEVLGKRRKSVKDQFAKTQRKQVKNTKQRNSAKNKKSAQPPPPKPPEELLEQQPENVNDQSLVAPVPEDQRVGDQSTDDEQEDDTEEPTEARDVYIGKKTCKEGRLAKLRSIKPYLVVIAGISEAEKLGGFFRDIQTVLRAGIEIELLLGKKPSTKNQGIDTIYAYLASEKVAKFLGAKAKHREIPVYIQDMTLNLTKSRPFDGVSFGPKVEAALGGNSQLLAVELQEAFENLKECEGAESQGGEIPAMQMNQLVPLNYFRFLDPHPQKYAFYTGDIPAGAGRSGMIYVHCEKKNADLFLKEMKAFKQPDQFYTDALFLSDIDYGFKGPTIKPVEVKPSNCVILTFAAAFEPNKKITVKNKNDVEGEGEHTMLQMLNIYASSIMSKDSNKTVGNFVKGNLVQGTRNLHFSKDMKRCIVWGTTAPMSVKEDEIKRLFPEVTDVDARFSR